MVHYPSFLSVDPNKFVSFSEFHQWGMTKLVGWVMVLELGLTSWSCWQNWFDWRLVVLQILVVMTWVFTFLVSVPLHKKLLSGYKQQVIESLIWTNWPRTFLWTFKAGLMLFWMESYVQV